MQDVLSQFTHSRVIFQITHGVFNTRNITVIPLQLLDFFQLHFPIVPLHLPIVPFDLVELVPSLSLVCINSSTSWTHEIGKLEAAFKTNNIPRPIKFPSRTPAWTLVASLDASLAYCVSLGLKVL
jgi:hypothetical protein